MPSFYQHIAFAATAIFTILLLAEPRYAAFFLAFFIASVFPDLDSKNSTVRKSASLILPAALSFFTVFNFNSDLTTRILAGLIVLFASHMAIVALPLSHRGKRSLHRKLFLLLFSAVIGIAVWWVFGKTSLLPIIISAMLGYATHIVADKMFSR